MRQNKEAWRVYHAKIQPMKNKIIMSLVNNSVLIRYETKVNLVHNGPHKLIK